MGVSSLGDPPEKLFPFWFASKTTKTLGTKTDPYTQGTPTTIAMRPAAGWALDTLRAKGEWSVFVVVFLCMDEILHRFETMGNHNFVSIYRGIRPFQGFLGGAGCCPSTVCLVVTAHVYLHVCFGLSCEQKQQFNSHTLTSYHLIQIFNYNCKGSFVSKLGSLSRSPSSALVPTFFGESSPLKYIRKKNVGAHSNLSNLEDLEECPLIFVIIIFSRGLNQMEVFVHL